MTHLHFYLCVDPGINNDSSKGAVHGKQVHHDKLRCRHSHAHFVTVALYPQLLITNIITFPAFGKVPDEQNKQSKVSETTRILFHFYCPQTEISPETMLGAVPILQ
jgi:hypothetical protein